MSKIIGTLTGVSDKQITAKTGKTYTLKMGQVQQANGNMVEINLGFKLPRGMTVGNLYEFETELKFGEEKYVSHSQSTEAAAKEALTSSPGQSGGAAPHYSKSAGFVVKTFPVPLDHPDRSIIRQNAMAHALRALEISGFDDIDPDAVVERAIALAMKVEDYATGDYEINELKKLEDSSD